jgi:hypothetical protein
MPNAVLGSCVSCDLWEMALPCLEENEMTFVDSMQSLFGDEEPLTESSPSRLQGTWVTMYTNYLEVPLYQKDVWTEPEYNRECVSVLSSAFLPSIVEETSRLSEILTTVIDESNYEILEVVRLQNRRAANMHRTFQHEYNIHNQCTVYHGAVYSIYAYTVSVIIIGEMEMWRCSNHLFQVAICTIFQRKFLRYSLYITLEWR